MCAYGGGNFAPLMSHWIDNDVLERKKTVLTLTWNNSPSVKNYDQEYTNRDP